MAYTKYSLTPANNTATPPDGAPEGMLPSAVNDTMRDMMAQIRDVGDGIRNGTYTMTAPVITGGSITGSTINNSAIGGSTAAAGTFTSLSDSGNLTFTGTGNRITGDFSNGTFSNRVAFQTSTTNGNTLVAAIPNGTSTTAGLWVYNNSDLTNAGRFRFSIGSGEASIISDYNGSGTYLPLIMLTGGSERLRIDTSGNVGINTTPVVNTTSKLFVNGDFTRVGASGAYCFNVYYDSVQARWEYAGTGTGATWVDSGSGNYTFQSTGSTSGNAGDAASLVERMRITSGGDLLVGTTTSTGRLTVRAPGNGNTDWSLSTASNAGTAQLRVRGDGAVYMGLDTTSPYNLTTGSAANAFLAADGFLQRSTSSLKYKTNVQDATHGLAEVLQLRPVTYKGKNDGDTVFGGLIAEEVDAIGLTEFVQYAEDGSPDALAYGNMVSLLAKAIQEQQAMIEELKQEVALLKAK